ncbi:MAG: hypothetical protein AAGF97_08790 [Planctomycetota bacterium]
MRLKPMVNQLIILALVTLVFGAPIFAQTDHREETRALTALSSEPGDLPQLSNTPSEGEGSVPVDSQQPVAEVDANGKIEGSSLSDRLESIRRKAVDTAISRPFLTSDPRANEGAPGDLAPVKRRSLKEPKAPVEVEQTPATASAPAAMDPLPQTAIQQSPRDQRAPSASRRLNTGPVEPRNNVLLTNQASALSVETIGPKTIVIGREATYRVSMLNTGNLDARNVIVSIRLPAWAEVTTQTASSGNPQIESLADDAATVSWPISFLKAKGREDLTLKIIPRDSRPFELGVGWAFAPEHSTAQIQVQEPKLEMNIHGPGEVNFGSTELFTISLSNPGTGDAENVVLNLMPLGAQQPIAGSRDLGTLRAGERKTIELELTAHQAGRLQVRAMAFADGGLRSESAQEVLVRQANLEMEVAGPPTGFASTTATYQVKIQNTGDAVAEDASLTTALPPGCVFVAANEGGRFEPESGLIQWQVGGIRPGGVRILEWTCEMQSAGENRFDIQCSAARQVTASRSVITKIEALADLKLRVNDPKGAVAVGKDAIYEVTVSNRGTKAAEMVTLVGYFSEGIEPVSLTGMRGQISTGQVTMDPITLIAPGQEVTFRITARAMQPGNHVFRAELQCNDPETRLAAEEWTKYYRSSSPARAVEPAGEALQMGQRLNLGEQADGNQFRQ